MKKYITAVLYVITLLTQSLLYGDSKCARLLADVGAQNLFQLKKGLLDDEYLAPNQYKQLIKEAKEIHEKLQKKLSILNDPRDYLTVLACGAQTLIAGLGLRPETMPHLIGRHYQGYEKRLLPDCYY